MCKVAKGEEIEVGMLLRCSGFGGGYATVLKKEVEWDTGRTSGEYYEWWKVQVIDGASDVYWFELDEHDVYIDYVSLNEKLSIIE